MKKYLFLVIALVLVSCTDQFVVDEWRENMHSRLLQVR